MNLVVTAIGWHTLTLTATPGSGNASVSAAAEVLFSNGLRPLFFYTNADGCFEVVCERVRGNDGNFVIYHTIGYSYYV